MYFKASGEIEDPQMRIVSPKMTGRKHSNKEEKAQNQHSQVVDSGLSVFIETKTNYRRHTDEYNGSERSKF